jgi:hypothetical protein
MIFFNPKEGTTMTTHRNLFQRWPSFLLAIIGMGMGLGLSIGTSALYSTIGQEEGKVIRHSLTFSPKPVQLLEIKTRHATVTLPAELVDLTIPVAMQMNAKRGNWLEGMPFKVLEVSGFYYLSESPKEN